MNEATPDAAVPKLELLPSRQFPSWLAEQNLSLAFTTYQSGKLFLVGLQPNGRLSIFERSFNRAMGLWASPETLFLSTLFQLWRFDNALEPRQVYQGYDRLYVPQVACTTGDLDVHDIAFDAKGRIVFVNTLFSCLATVSETHSFTPLWRPPFISKLAAEDRCHLNGLALKDGSAAYVTAVSRADVADGWRDRRTGGGGVPTAAARSSDTAGGRGRARGTAGRVESTGAELRSRRSSAGGGRPASNARPSALGAGLAALPTPWRARHTARHRGRRTGPARALRGSASARGGRPPCEQVHPIAR